MTSLTSVLIVDDEPAVRDLMARWVTSLGLEAQTAANADEALELLQTKQADLAVIDIVMPGHDGFWLADALRRDHPRTAVVIATAHTSLLDASGDAPHVADLLVKPFARERFVMALERGRHWRKETIEELAWQTRLTLELRDRTEILCVELSRWADAGARESKLLRAMCLTRTPDTTAHSERVAVYAVWVARELGLTGEAVEQLEDAARFHDIGKLAIPDSLLNKPSVLTPVEQTIVRRHVDTGAEILASIRTMHELAAIVLATHEWFDGGGYPLQLTATAIPLASRIIAVADAYDAMTQDRPYRSRIDSAEAVCELLRCAGTQFDPDIVDAFLAALGRH